MRKTGWEKSTKGPDWIDAIAMIRALGALHSGRVEVLLSPVGTGFDTSVRVTAQCTFDLLPGSSLPALVTASDEWPTVKHSSMAGMVYMLLLQLDYEISKVYNQESLWK